MTDTSSLSQLQTISIAFQGFVAGIVLVLFSAINFHVFALSFGLTFVPIIALMYWPQKASRSWSIVLVFLLGILQATLSFTPLGLWAFCYLVVFIILGGEITFNKTLSSSWGSFLVLIIFTGSILYIVGRLLLGQWPPLTPLLTDAFASFLIFPLIFWVRSFVSAFGVEPERREIS